MNRLWSGAEDFLTTFGTETPRLAVIRVALLQMIIDILQEEFPQRKNTHPVIPPIPDLTGMERIRALFVQYITKTIPRSLERYKLALEILLEKENLDLPSAININTDITLYPGFAPGDFSYLDLSYLDLRREDGLDGGFQGLILHNSNCDGSNWSGLSLLNADFKEGALRGANLSHLSNNKNINLTGTDVEGSYFGEEYAINTLAINHTKVSRSEEALTDFQAQLQKKIELEKLRKQLIKTEEHAEALAQTLAEIKAKSEASAQSQRIDNINIQRFKEAYFRDYHSRFFKNSSSTMKSILENNLIHSMSEIRKYASDHPNSRTARIYFNLPLVTLENLETEAASAQTVARI